MKFKVGQNIRARYKNRNKLYAWEAVGTIVKIVPPLQPLTEFEMKEYANLSKGDRGYKSVEGKTCNVCRLIVETERGFVIIPSNRKRFEITMLEKSV